VHLGGLVALSDMNFTSRRRGRDRQHDRTQPWAVKTTAFNVVTGFLDPTMAPGATRDALTAESASIADLGLIRTFSATSVFPPNDPFTTICWSAASPGPGETARCHSGMRAPVVGRRLARTCQRTGREMGWPRNAAPTILRDRSSYAISGLSAVAPALAADRRRCRQPDSA